MDLEEIEKQQNIKFILKEQWCWDDDPETGFKKFIVFRDPYDNYIDSVGANWIHIVDEKPVKPVYIPQEGDWGYFWNDLRDDVFIVSQIDIVTETISKETIYFSKDNITPNPYKHFKFISKEKPNFVK